MSKFSYWKYYLANLEFKLIMIWLGKNLFIRCSTCGCFKAIYWRSFTGIELEPRDLQLETGATHLEIDQGRLQGRDLYLETDHGPVTACQRERGLCLEIALPQESDPPQPIIAVSVTDRRLPIQIVTTTNQGVGHHHLQVSYKE